MIEKYTKDYYPFLNSWAEKRGKFIPENMLSKNGYVKKDVFAIFLYQTDSPLAIIEMAVSNPDAPVEKILDAVEEMLPVIIDDAKKLGVKVLVGYSRHKFLMDVGEKFGFKKENVRSLWKEL